MGKISEWTFLGDQKKMNFQNEKNEKTKNEKVHFFIFPFFFIFFSFCKSGLTWKFIPEIGSTWKFIFFPFWNFDQQDGSLCSILFSLIFFCNFEKSEIVFLLLFFLFLDF